MNVYKEVPKQFHEQYLEVLASLTEGGVQKENHTHVDKEADPEKIKTISTRLRLRYALPAAAAVFLTTIILCVADPVMAAKLPVIGKIFTVMQGHFGFGKLPEEGTVVLTPEPDTSESDTLESGTPDSGNTVSKNRVSESDALVSDQENTRLQESASPYQASGDGVTLSIEEYYASNQAIFLGIRMVTEEVLTDDLADKMLFLTNENYSFRKDDPNQGAWSYEYQRIDEHTFFGILRIDYDSIRRDTHDIPEEFTMDIEFQKLWIYHTSTDAGQTKQTIKGSWLIKNIPIRQSADGMQTIVVNDVNEAGFGVSHIELSPVELTIYPIEPADQLTFAVVLDKDGQILRFGGDNAYQLAVDGHDISEITVYICNYDEYMDVIKEYTLADDAMALKKILEEQCLYQKTIALNSADNNN